MDALSKITLVLCAGVLVAYALWHWYQARTYPKHSTYRIASPSTIVVERDERTVDNAEAMTVISYSAQDPMALKFDYTTSNPYFGHEPITKTVLVARDQIAHALATGSSKNIHDSAEILSVWCSASHLKGKGNTTITWQDSHSVDVNILTVPTRYVLRAINDSYVIVAPGQELDEPSNNLDQVLEGILMGSSSRHPNNEE